jgi:NAD(P)-dependent dehydrogenase (short-subunit alcohol dehydrogenase family)
MDEMSGKVGLITGASSGIGRACAYRFAAAGAKVVLVARSGDVLDDIVGEIEADGGTASAIAADVTDSADIERVADEAIATFGGVDVLINAAGIISNGTVENTGLEDWDYMMNINVRAPFYLTQRVLPSLIERQGNVVNVSSVTGIRAFPGVLAYCVSKAGVSQMTRCAALELAGKGVRMNAVCPGVVVTQLHRRGGMADEAYAAFLEHSKTTHPLGRVGGPEEVADLIFFLASPQASWITGANIPIDGGRAQTCAR